MDEAGGASDTIVAIATAAGAGGVGIVRLSGPRSRPIADIVLVRSQSLTDTFKVAKGLVTDADVRVSGGGGGYQLVYRALGGRMGGELHALQLETAAPSGDQK